MECLNCGTEHDGAFCPNCGQKVYPQKFSTRLLIRQFFGIITNVERGFWFTLWRLAIAPHTVIQDYWKGRTLPYFNPFRLLVVISTLVAIVTVNLGVLLDFGAELASVKPEQQEMMRKWMELVAKNFNFLVILSVPMYTIFSWLLLRKRGYSAGEHLLLNTFLVSERQLVYALIVLPAMAFWQEGFVVINVVFTLAAWGYYAWALIPLFQLSVGKAILYSFLINALATVLYVLFTFIFTIISFIILISTGVLPPP